ncbi:MAG: hypothetical protein JWN44_3960 [Myxococcales bacterium]|nr:hypothetical protein [Myxococcales bacterium]
MRSRTWKLARLVAPIGLIPLFACLAPPVESPKTNVIQETTVRVDQSVKNKVDLLFLVDNSLSMQPKQDELRKRFPQLIKILDDFSTKGNPASYHIGVVTSDLGSATNMSACKPGGDGAKLQVTPSPAAVNPPAGCSTFSLSGGVRFIDYNQITGTNNIVGGLDVPTAFSCMAAVGDMGCGFEHQLEAVYRALHDPITENSGFLRPDAILAVVFVTDEDDCSAPTNSDLFDASAAGVNSYGTLHSFRCTNFGVECNGALVSQMSASGLMQCTDAKMANGGKLFETQRYKDFFTKPAAQGGVKTNPDDVILVAISAPSDQVSVQVTTPCKDVANVASCPILTHSCVAATNMNFFGDPAVRLNGVVNSAKNHSLTSICDTDYTAAIQSLGDLIISQIGAGCLNSPIANRTVAGMQVPDCVVEDVTSLSDGSKMTSSIASCAENGHKIPCWQVIDKLAQYKSQGCTPVGTTPPATCKLPPTCQPVTNPIDMTQQLVTVSIDRGLDTTGKPNTAPAGTVANVSCATVASSSK